MAGSKRSMEKHGRKSIPAGAPEVEGAAVAECFCESAVEQDADGAAKLEYNLLFRWFVGLVVDQRAGLASDGHSRIEPRNRRAGRRGG